MSVNESNRSKRFSDSLQFMTIDLLENILKYSDNPGKMGEYLTTQIRELVGGRIVCLVRHSQSKNLYLHRIISVSPERYTHQMHGDECQKLSEYSLHLDKATIWSKNDSHSGITEILESLGYDITLAVPLNIGSTKVGVLYVFDIFDLNNLEEILKPFEVLSSIIALILRNSLLYEDQETIIASRTKDLLIINERYQLAQKVANIGSWELDLITMNRYWSEGSESILGFEKEKLGTTQSDYLNLVHPDDRSKISEYLKICLEQGKKYEATYRILNSDGTIRWVLSSGNVVCDENGKPVRMLGIVQDITTRKKMEDLLRESEERFRTLVENAPESIFIQIQDKFAYVNSAALKLFGANSHEDIIGKSVSERIHPDYMKIKNEKINDLNIKNTPIPMFELKYLRLDGTEIDAESSAAPFKFENQKCALVFTHEISDRKEADAERLKLQKLESLGLLAGGIAHDFNNILTSILGHVSLILEEAVDGEVKNSLTSVEKATKRAAALTRQLLTFARGSNPEKCSISVRNIIKEITRFSLSGSNVTVNFNFEDTFPLEADPGQISQVIQNLVINAKQAMPAGGSISISTEDCVFGNNIKGVRIIFSDSGRGISSDNLMKVFDPYFTTKKTGSGLGLSVCYSIIKQHNGEILVDSEAGRGTTFIIILPSSSKIKESIKKNTNIITKKLNCLVMDDEPDIRELLSMMLNRMGHSATVSSTGEEALVLYKNYLQSKKPFDLVFLDLTVKGGMGGKETVKKIKEFHPEALAIVTSGYSSDDTLSNFEEIGFDGKLNKPYTKNELNNVIYQVIMKNNNAVPG